MGMDGLVCVRVWWQVAHTHVPSVASQQSPERLVGRNLSALKAKSSYVLQNLNIVASPVRARVCFSWFLHMNLLPKSRLFVWNYCGSIRNEEVTAERASLKPQLAMFAAFFVKCGFISPPVFRFVFCYIRANQRELPFCSDTHNHTGRTTYTCTHTAASATCCILTKWSDSCLLSWNKTHHLHFIGSIPLSVSA